MSLDETTPDWPAFTSEELAEVLSSYSPLHGALPRVLWSAPRPMSTSARVGLGDEVLFVKRHHRTVRDGTRLALEHRFSDHLRSRGLDTPRVRRRLDEESVTTRGEFVYEVFDLARGHDRYADVPSWLPYHSPEDARGAGVALACFHEASSGFEEPASPFGVLVDSTELLRSADPLHALSTLVDERPGLATGLSNYPYLDEMVAILAGPLARARDATWEESVLWTHGDWHPSNMTWTNSSEVASVIDLSLANRTFALRDLALAIERAVVDWLDSAGRGEMGFDEPALRALLSGYHSRRPLTRADLETLVALLPVVHVEFALSEVEYFATVTGSLDNCALAYRGYLLGHVQWFSTPPGRQLLDVVLLADR
jgi:Ser/Thr protein kinase RdoA (MazF antagonist)